MNERKYTLFSAVGSTDPISNERDGPLLHICRKYRPEKAILYLSKEMLAHERGDGRYTRCIEWLCRDMGFQCSVELIEKPELTEVQLFDVFYAEFDPILKRLHSENPDNELLVNASSGTAAMIGALNGLSIMQTFPVTAVQVSTPLKAQNPRREDQQDYDAELQWAFDMDNMESKYADRCTELKSPNLSARLLKESICRQAAACDYEAACATAEQISDFMTDYAMELLYAARERIKLNYRALFNLNAEDREYILGRCREEQRKLVEYLLWLRLKQRRGDTADFVRGITPALYVLAMEWLKQNKGVSIQQYCDSRGYLCRTQLEKDKLGLDILKLLDDRNNHEYREKYLNSDTLVYLMDCMYHGDADVSRFLKLREFEYRVRNTVAHTVQPISERWMKDAAGMDSAETLALFTHLANTILSLQRDIWDSYERMNEVIIKNIKA